MQLPDAEGPRTIPHYSANLQQVGDDGNGPLTADMLLLWASVHRLRREVFFGAVEAAARRERARRGVDGDARVAIRMNLSGESRLATEMSSSMAYPHP